VAGHRASASSEQVERVKKENFKNPEGRSVQALSAADSCVHWLELNERQHNQQMKTLERRRASALPVGRHTKTQHIDLPKMYPQAVMQCVME
jgi:hypothetical protein